MATSVCPSRVFQLKASIWSLKAQNDRAPSQLCWESSTPQHLFSEARHLFFFSQKRMDGISRAAVLHHYQGSWSLVAKEARSRLGVQSVDSYLTLTFFSMASHFPPHAIRSKTFLSSQAFCVRVGEGSLGDQKGRWLMCWCRETWLHSRYLASPRISQAGSPRCLGGSFSIYKVIGWVVCFNAAWEPWNCSVWEFFLIEKLEYVMRWYSVGSSLEVL